MIFSDKKLKKELARKLSELYLPENENVLKTLSNDKGFPGMNV